MPNRDACLQRSAWSESTSTREVSEVIVEISTPGARSPIHFMEWTAASFRCSSRGGSDSGCRGGSSSGCLGGSSSGCLGGSSGGCRGSPTRIPTGRGRGPLLPTLFGQRPGVPAATAASLSTSSFAAGMSFASKAGGKRHRQTSSPLDGACLTLLGVSMGLKIPGVDTWAVAQALVQSSVDLRTRNERGMTPLHLACSAGQLDVVNVLLLAGADSHARDHRSRCPLHMAALSGNADLVTSLLTCGADPNKASDLGTTALHNAALLGRVEVARALLLAGADPNSTDFKSFSPLYLASQNGHTQLVLDLLSAGADAGIKTTKGFTPLHVAARCGRLAVLRALLDAGEAVDSLSSPAETTPLHLAAGFSRLSCVHELLRRGADPSRENRRGATPLDMAGTVIVPVNAAAAAAAAAAGTGSRADRRDGSKAALARQASEERLVQTEQVKATLTRAQRWQRRRGLVLAWVVIRSRAALAADAAAARAGTSRKLGGGGGVCVGQPGGDCRSKRHCRRSQVGGGDGGGLACSGQGWLVAQLCAHADPVLMKSVVLFL